MASSARIQEMIMECLSEGGARTVAELKAYVESQPDGSYTSGQFAGSLTTLVRNGSILRVERGSYKKNNRIDRGDDERAARHPAQNAPVYLLSNPCIENWCVIGTTEDRPLGEILNMLNGSAGLPQQYRCCAYYISTEPYRILEAVRRLIDENEIRPEDEEGTENHQDNTYEFIPLSPEKVYAYLRTVAVVRGEEERLSAYPLLTDRIPENPTAVIRPKRSNNSFRLIGIAEGTKIYFLHDSRIMAVVQDQKNHVTYEGKTYTVSGLAQKLLHERSGWSESIHVNGWRFFTKDGVTLSEMRDRIESDDEQE